MLTFVWQDCNLLKINDMFGTLIRKKVSNDKLANVFINGLWDASEKGFPMVADFINEDPTFIKSPNVSSEDHTEFALIIMIGNMNLLESTFDGEQAFEVERLIFEKLAKVYDMSVFEFKSVVKDYRHLMMRLNHPSKNVIYSISKMIFDKYALYNFQDEYFQRMQVPNPLFLKRLDEVIENFLWDWDAFFKRYKMD
ncbi:MAG: hypothetical protein ACI837_000999 [Crocinitomicaceae bacterium]|jgi:hypothetical protein